MSGKRKVKEEYCWWEIDEKIREKSCERGMMVEGKRKEYKEGKREKVHAQKRPIQLQEASDQRWPTTHRRSHRNTLTLELESPTRWRIKRKKGPKRHTP